MECKTLIITGTLRQAEDVIRQYKLNRADVRVIRELSDLQGYHAPSIRLIEYGEVWRNEVYGSREYDQLKTGVLQYEQL